MQTSWTDVNGNIFTFAGRKWRSTWPKMEELCLFLFVLVFSFLFSSPCKLPTQGRENNPELICSFFGQALKGALV